MTDPVAIALIAAASANALAMIGVWSTTRQTHKAVNSERTTSLQEIKQLQKDVSRLEQALKDASKLQAVTESHIPKEKDQ
jgi:hypothetical protein